MSGSLIARAELTAPWGLGLEPFRAAVFHVVISGSGLLRTEEGRTIRLSAGDVAVLMGGQRHELMSEPGVPITSFADLMDHCVPGRFPSISVAGKRPRSEEHTSELQSRPHLVCRLLLEQ